MKAVRHRGSENDVVAAAKKPLPPWLLGLLIAIALFAIGLLIFSALGYGDDPVIDPNISGVMRATIGL